MECDATFKTSSRFISCCTIGVHRLLDNHKKKVLYDPTHLGYLVKFIETGGRMVCAMGWGKGQRGCCLTQTEFPFGKMKRSGDDGHDGCKTM